MAHLRIEHAGKTFKGGTVAVGDISFEVEDRSAVFLLGPSGAGKTTTLRMVAGLEEPDRGRILIGGRDVTRLMPRERNVAMVYDKHSLFPHMSVFENMAYPLRVRKLGTEEIRRRIAPVAEVLQIEQLLARMPGQLSGGQMQRVAIGRALVRDADVFLLDEPISHLDAQLRARMRVEFKRLQRDFKATMLYVSHDQLEAMTMADRIVLINKGRIEQIDRPQDLFDRPRTLFAATFIGEPAMNAIPAEIVEKDDQVFLEIGTSLVPANSDWARRHSARIGGRRTLTVGIRPQHLRLAAPADRAARVVHGRIFAVETLGSRGVFDIEVAGEVVRVVTTIDQARSYPQTIGAPIGIEVDPAFIYLFDRATGETVAPAKFTELADQPAMA